MKNSKLKVGYYFDLYSTEVSHWKAEAEFNKTLEPHFLEVMLEYPGSSSFFDEGRQAQLKDAVGKIPLNVHAPTLGLSLVSTNEMIAEASVREHLYALHVAKGLGAEFMTIHGGDFPFYAPASADISPGILFVKNVTPILKVASQLGIDICLENLKGTSIFPKTFEDLDKAFVACPTLKMALDIRHFYIEGFDPLEGYLRYQPRILSVHYRIDNGLSDDALRVFIETLIETKYTGCFMIEDKTLNTMDKTNKKMLYAGRDKIFSILESM